MYIYDDVSLLVYQTPTTLLYHCCISCVKYFKMKLTMSTWNVLNAAPFVMSRRFNVSFNARYHPFNVM